MAKSTGGVTKTTAFRLGDHSLAMLDAIAAEPEYEGNRTAALKAAIRRLHHQTIGVRPAPKKSRKKPV